MIMKGVGIALMLAQIIGIENPSDKLEELNLCTGLGPRVQGFSTHLVITLFRGESNERMINQIIKDHKIKLIVILLLGGITQESNAMCIDMVD
jgi:hypothetical protein